MPETPREGHQNRDQIPFETPEARRARVREANLKYRGAAVKRPDGTPPTVFDKAQAEHAKRVASENLRCSEHYAELRQGELRQGEPPAEGESDG